MRSYRNSRQGTSQLCYLMLRKGVSKSDYLSRAFHLHGKACISACVASKTAKRWRDAGCVSRNCPTTSCIWPFLTSPDTQRTMPTAESKTPRSEERRVGKEGRSRPSRFPLLE